MDTMLVYITAAAFFGALLHAFMGYLNSHDAFDARKFGKSIILALQAAIGAALIFNTSDTIVVRDILLAITAGAGWNGLNNYAEGALTAADKKP